MMKFYYLCLLIIFFTITSCNFKGEKNKVVVPAPGSPIIPSVQDQNAKLCPDNTWSITGHEPKCTACPENSTVIKTKNYCVCQDNNKAFNASDNTCKNKLTESQMKFLLF